METVQVVITENADGIMRLSPPEHGVNPDRD